MSGRLLVATSAGVLGTRLAIFALAVALVACGGDDTHGGAAPDTDAVTLDPPDAGDVSPPTDGVIDASADIVIDVADADLDMDDADTTLDADTALDIADADTVPAVAACEVPSLVDMYPPPLPPFPYGDWDPPTDCVARPHDVVMVLGCPSNADGSPSDCQKKRAEMADFLYESGWSTNFIVSGAAVHNEFVESDALFDLLVGRGIPAASIIKEPRAAHTDENIYFSTRIMQAHGWTTAIVVSEDPGHLMFTGLCDADCCVDLGKMTLYAFPVEGNQVVKAGHYALSPPATLATSDECSTIKGEGLCVNQDQRKACRDDFQLDPP